MTRSAQCGSRLLKAFLFYQQIVRIEGGDGEETDSGASQRFGERGENPNFRKCERPLYFQATPSDFRGGARRSTGFLADDGKFVAGPRYGEEFASRRPIRQRGIPLEPANCKSARKQLEAKLVRRHRGSEQTADVAAVHGNRCAVYVAGPLGHQKCHHRRKFLRPAQTPQRHHGGPAFEYLFAGNPALLRR
jgi:hypothetical protein